MRRIHRLPPKVVISLFPKYLTLAGRTFIAYIIVFSKYSLGFRRGLHWNIGLVTRDQHGVPYTPYQIRLRDGGEAGKPHMNYYFQMLSELREFLTRHVPTEYLRALLKHI